jgi:hypothetical protein
MRIQVYSERLSSAVLQGLKTTHFYPLAAAFDVQNIR